MYTNKQQRNAKGRGERRRRMDNGGDRDDCRTVGIGHNKSSESARILTRRPSSVSRHGNGCGSVRTGGNSHRGGRSIGDDGDRMLSPLTSYPPCELNIFRHNRNAFGVNGAQIGIFKQRDEIRFRSFLQRQDGGCLES